jgi:hypothetical protein
MAAGPIAGVVVYLAHAPLDWDWQMPAVTLVALILAGSLLAASELPASVPALATDRNEVFGGVGNGADLHGAQTVGARGRRHGQSSGSGEPARSG